ncbi:unnamed protein product, partial [marine sediment metagenome]
MLGARLESVALGNVSVRLRCGETVRVDGRHPQWRKFVDCGCHELGTENFLVDYLLPGDVVVDVGANVGLITVIAAKRVGPFGRVYAFEPDEENCSSLDRAVQLNRLGNVRIERLALGDRDGEARFLKPQGSVGAYQVPELHTSISPSPTVPTMNVLERRWGHTPRTEFS